jgi:hypothetical protein
MIGSDVSRLDAGENHVDGIGNSLPVLKLRFVQATKATQLGGFVGKKLRGHYDTAGCLPATVAALPCGVCRTGFSREIHDALTHMTHRP